MLQQIDHIVVVVRDLAQAVGDYERAGFVVTPGGEHVGGATHNALIPFADGTYFELIAFREPDRPQEHRWWPRIQRGEGLVDYALLTDDLAAETRRLEESNVAFAGPVEGGRTRLDGQRLVWRSIFLGKGAGGSACPFVIQDVTPRDLRVPDGLATEHPNGIRGVAGLTVLVADLAEAGAELEELLGDEWQTAETPDGRAMRFPIGNQWIQLVQPYESAVPEAYLQQFRDSPYEVELFRTVPGTPGAGELLDGSLHGARLRVGDAKGVG